MPEADAMANLMSHDLVSFANRIYVGSCTTAGAERKTWRRVTI
jgi:hypothetical protein